LARSFVEKNGGGCGSVEGFHLAGHGDADAGVGAAFDFFRQARAFVTDKEGNGLTPIDFPRGERRGRAKARPYIRSRACVFAHARSRRGKPRPYRRRGRTGTFVDARSERANACDFELR